MNNENYDFTLIEKKWQNFWEENKSFKVDMKDTPREKRFYCLDMFPYPSGAGLHVGHPEGYTATDIVCRYKRMQGFNVLHPMGWDSFGLPAENYAIKTGTHPKETTKKNIDNFRRQIKALGFSYDWDREVATSDTNYFHWTQWIFLQLYKAGLAYQKEAPINFCPDCKTGLSNEEVTDGKCARCNTPVVRKTMKQWMLRITDYADKLLEGLDELEWSEPIKTMQRNWIGRSTGAEVDFKIDGLEENLRVYTTRPDTLFGATYMVVAPEHKIVEKLVTAENKQEVEAYIKAAMNKSDLERTDLADEKTGVFTGGYAINPVNGEKVPIWISDYILISYGTGAIMAVPAHDTRDFEFATKFKLPIKQVVANDENSPEELTEAFIETGIAINSGEFNGLKTEDFKEKITAWLTEKKLGEKAVHYKLRDWIFSRQRYWGEPIPVVHCDKCGVVPLKATDLPLKLPEVESYQPTGDGSSPLASIEEWVNTTCPTCGGSAKRETDTMPQWAGSCWYYIRYLDPKNATEFASKESIDYWLPVDLYVGGAEHAVLHLLYSRFWHKFLYDQGLITTKEPYQKLVNQGLIMGEDGQKMSKSLGNVISPDVIIDEFGSDAMRLYEMFMGPLEASKPWNTKGIRGIKRFLEKAWRLLEKDFTENKLDNETEKLLHKTIKKVTHDLEELSFNTGISALMILLNHISQVDKLPKEAAIIFVKLMAPFAPHLGEELWEKLNNDDTITYEKWPEFDEAKTVDSEIQIVFQVNGKMRDKASVSAGITPDEMEKIAMASEKVQSFLEGKTVVKVIKVPGKLVNIVAK